MIFKCVSFLWLSLIVKVFLKIDFFNNFNVLLLNVILFGSDWLFIFVNWIIFIIIFY